VPAATDDESLEKSSLSATTPDRRRTRDFGFLPVPRGCEYGDAFAFTRSLNWLLAVGATVTVANLYVVQPILVELSQRFEVDYEEVTRVPSLLQGGYLVGCVL